jgi:hypothetical protein
MDYGSIIVQAGMGVGKSKEESNYLNRLAEKHGVDNLVVVKLSHRKAFTSQEVKRLNDETVLDFVSCADIPGNTVDLSKNPCVVIQYESLHQMLRPWDIEGKTLVLLCDEWNSLMRQMESNAGESGADMLMFETLIRFSSYRLFMDACTNVNTVNACRAFLRDAGKEEPRMIINEYKKHGADGTEIIQYVDSRFLESTLHAHIKKGKRGVVVTHSKRKANEIQMGIRQRFPEKTVLIYTGETPAELKRDHFRDVNETWKDADIVIYNSTCEAGISCIIAEFQDVFAFFSQELVCVQASFQMVGRIRNMKRLHMHVHAATLTLSHVLRRRIDRESIFNVYKGERCVPFQSALKMTADAATLEGTAWGEVYYANARHRNASQCSFEHLFLELCKSSGMTVRETVRAQQTPDKNFEWAVKERMAAAEVSKAQVVADAPEITSDVAETLRYCKVPTQQETACLEKYFLSTSYKVPISSINCDFVVQYNDKRTKAMHNAQYSLRFNGKDALSSIDYMKITEKSKMKALYETKEQEIDEFVTKHGMEHSKKNVMSRYWHDISIEQWRKHQIVHELLSLTTGFSGLEVAENRQNATIFGWKIRERLGYPAPKRGPRKGVLKYGEEGCVGPDALDRLHSIYKDIDRFLPDYQIQAFQGPIKMDRVIRVLNTVLYAVYGYSFKRRGKTDSYRLCPSELFGEGTAVPLPAWGARSQRFER